MSQFSYGRPEQRDVSGARGAPGQTVESAGSPLAHATLPKGRSALSLAPEEPLGALSKSFHFGWKAKFLGLDRILDKLLDGVLRDWSFVVRLREKSYFSKRFVRRRALADDQLYLSRPESRPLVERLEGRSDLPRVICVDGLGGRGGAWREVGELLNRRYGFPIEFRALHGSQRGGLEALSDFCLDRSACDLADSVLDAGKSGVRPILLLHSFAALVGKAVQSALKDHIHEAIAVGPPFVVVGSKGRSLSFFARLYNFPPFRPFIKRLLIEQPTQLASPGDPEHDRGFRLVPFPVYAALHEMQRRVSRHHKKQGLTPGAVFLGQDDCYVTADAMRDFLSKGPTGGEMKLFVLPDMPHSPMYTRGRWRFFRALARYLDRKVTPLR